MSDEPDFRIDGFEPADTDSEYAEQRFQSGDLTVLAEHHTTPNRSHSFIVAHDRSVTWGIPGEPQVAAFAVVRDLSTNTFTIESAYHATVSFAQNWLIERGCPSERISRVGEGFMKPADYVTDRVEKQIRTSGTQYEVLDTDSTDYDPCETWTLARDSYAAQAPIRVFLEEGSFDTHTYTMREGAFADEGAARRWLDDRSGPLPEPPEYRDYAAAMRARAALNRSARSSAIPTAGFLITSTAPSANTAQHPSPRRPM
ncbi:glycosyl hydrolase [Streptomyces sp. NBC_01471]|uniref:glycosyl hydrolase n=1 Tax=Streptomyces sp. NBC_01471 TaxID=2903879 RepID=UPI00324A9687